MRRPLLALLAVLGIALTPAVLPAPAEARVKIDRYEPGTLPRFRLWVTLLADTTPVRPDRVKGFSVFVNGDMVDDDADFVTSADVGMPMAMGIVVDARQSSVWGFERTAIQELTSKLPGKSEGFVIATHDGLERVPEDEELPPLHPLTDRPETLAASLQDVRTGGSDPYFYQAIKRALSAFPLWPGVDAEAEDSKEGAQPPARGPKAAPFPMDRVLVVIGRGDMERLGDNRTPPEQLYDLVRLARKRGVRMMTVGLSGSSEESEALWTMRILARKTGGTYREVGDPDALFAAAQEVGQELGGRFVVTADSPELRPGDPAAFAIKAVTTLGENEESREYEATVEHAMGFFARLADRISDWWEKAPWWARALIIFGVLIVVAIITLVIVVRRLRRARNAAAATAAAKAKALAARRPCPICGQLMMPDWKSCLFCAAPKQAPARFRLTGRAGAWAGQALRFDKDLVTFGSGTSVDVQVPERRVALEHCGLRDRGTEFILSDFNTEAGTFVNGERIAQVRLQEGDVIRIGETELVFGIEAE